MIVHLLRVFVDIIYNLFSPLQQDSRSILFRQPGIQVRQFLYENAFIMAEYYQTGEKRAKGLKWLESHENNPIIQAVIVYNFLIDFIKAK